MTRWHKIHGLSLIALLVVAGLGPVQGAVITLKIRAINPSTLEKKKVPVKALLPQKTKPEDVINSGELEVSYDVAARTYMVSKDVELAPSETRTFDVVIKDVWVIPDEDLKTLSVQAGKLGAALKDTDKADTAAGVKALIDEGIKAIQSRQAAAAVGAVKPVDHIRVYEANMEVLGRVRKDTGVLENLAIAAGKDLDAIMGLPKLTPAPDNTSSRATGAVMGVYIKITNPSLTEKRKVPLKYEFPAEVRTTDIIDAAGLQISYDAGKSVCYAYQEDIELGPQESKVYEVKIRDPWGGLVEKMIRLEQRCQDILVICKDMESYKVVGAQATAVLKDLEALKAKKGPAPGAQGYVAFSRQQADSLQGLDSRVQRLEEIFQPHEKPIANGIPIMDVPRPDKRTTWILIYMVLAFLGVFSVLFYVRWYGKGKDEKLGSSDRGPSGKT